jgi:predicted transcriptional regulator
MIATGKHIFQPKNTVLTMIFWLIPMVNRDRHEITIEILKKTISGKKKTEIIRDVGLSYLQSKNYLDELERRGLLEIDLKKNFKTTKKGLEFLEKCQECPLFKWDKGKGRSSQK